MPANPQNRPAQHASRANSPRSRLPHPHPGAPGAPLDLHALRAQTAHDLRENRDAPKEIFSPARTPSHDPAPPAPAALAQCPVPDPQCPPPVHPSSSILHPSERYESQRNNLPDPKTLDPAEPYPLPDDVERDRLLFEYLEAPENALELANNHDISLQMLVDWIEHPYTQKQLYRLRKVIARRAEDMRAHAAAAAASSLYQLVRAPKYMREHISIPHELRAMELAYKAAVLILYPPKRGSLVHKFIPPFLRRNRRAPGADHISTATSGAGLHQPADPTLPKPNPRAPNDRSQISDSRSQRREPPPPHPSSFLLHPSASGAGSHPAGPASGAGSHPAGPALPKLNATPDDYNSDNDDDPAPPTGHRRLNLEDLNSQSSHHTQANASAPAQISDLKTLSSCRSQIPNSRSQPSPPPPPHPSSFLVHPSSPTPAQPRAP